MGKMKTVSEGEVQRIISLEGSQALPVRPSCKSGMQVKALEWLEVVVV
jgi:hypothetical protein